MNDCTPRTPTITAPPMTVIIGPLPEGEPMRSDGTTITWDPGQAPPQRVAAVILSVLLDYEAGAR